MIEVTATVKFGAETSGQNHFIHLGILQNKRSMFIYVFIFTGQKVLFKIGLVNDRVRCSESSEQLKVFKTGISVNFSRTEDDKLPH